MSARVGELAAISVVAVLVTVAMSAPVLRAPSERVFGMEIVGRHHDPFTVMTQFGRPISRGVYSQPVTDIIGSLLARVAGEVAAYNWLTLLSFPLSAAAAFLLGRYLSLSQAGAALAAMAYAFSPFHLAQAAYHPHIAQTQWLPLYLLALWRCLDQPTPAAAGFLGAATVAVTLSNFYAGFMMAVMTPVAVGAHWLATRQASPRPIRRLGITVGSLALIATFGLGYASAASAIFQNRAAAFEFPRGDLFRYSAKWWSYLVPPVEHPLLGATALRLWTAVDVRDGLLEQQVSVGWGLVALAVIAVVPWLSRDRQPSSVARVPVLAVIAAAAFVCSLAPERTIGAFMFVGPSAWLYSVAPMFRAYARFGVIVQLMVALLAGVGVDRLRHAGTVRARIICIALVAMAAGEYLVSPSALWRDVLPTSAHRWVMRQTPPATTLDCAPLTQESESVVWLTGYRVTLLGRSITDCTDPNLSRALMANGYAHVLVRRDTANGEWFANHPAPDGLRLVEHFDDGQVFAVAAAVPAVYTAAMTGFFHRERDATWSWRWMAADASWTIMNSHTRPMVATVGLEMSAFHHPRRIGVRLDGRDVQWLVVDPSRATYQIGPLTVVPGAHELAFLPAEPPTTADDLMDNGDRRLLSVALGTWNWRVEEEQP